ncbi:MAG: protein kinase, partial [Gemmatimonadota bacterium]
MRGNVRHRHQQRFIREAKAASALDHANICTIHDIAETEDGELYIVMAHYAGRTLRERLSDEEWPVERCLDAGLQLARALERAHEAGIVHRDLKPANVMLTDRGEVKLLDFGVAKLASGEHLTRTGSTLGTLSYMSPEQLSGEEADHRSDLWALGVILYEMLAGRQPFEAGQEAAVMYAIGLSKDRGERPSGAGEVCAVLSRALGQGRQRPEGPDGALVTAGPARSGVSEAPSAGASATETRFRRRVLVAAIPALLAVVALVYWTGGRGGDPSRSTGMSENLLAVVPFTVRGSPEFAYLGEGIVDLMSAKLDGAGSLSTVNPRVVIAMINEEGLDVSDPRSGLRVASRVGAGRYVTGDLLEVGGRVTLTAYLHDTAGAETPLEQASAEGRAGDLFDIVDGLVVDLLAGSMSGPTDRLQKLAVATSHSLEATKEYLRGEQLLRQGRYREAGAAYDLAVGLDPEFALAHYRKSLAADWTDAYDVRSSAERALELAEHLSPRDRNLLSALLLRRTGQNRRAEQAYRAHLHTYPDDVEALLQLGEVLFHANPRWGSDMREAREPFAKAVDLEPVNSNARIHLARLYALRGDL